MNDMHADMKSRAVFASDISSRFSFYIGRRDVCSTSRRAHGRRNKHADISRQLGAAFLAMSPRQIKHQRPQLFHDGELRPTRRKAYA